MANEVPVSKMAGMYSSKVYSTGPGFKSDTSSYASPNLMAEVLANQNRIST